MAYQNFFATRLATDIGANDTAITLETIPTATSGRLVLEARNPTQREIIKYTGISGNQITGVTRGQGGTTAKGHLKNSLVEMNVTAEDLGDALSVPSDIVTRFDEQLADNIAKGTGVVASVSGLQGSITDITYYINGYRYTKTGIANKTYTASKDTYVFIDTNGNITYTEVANYAAAPATPANNILIAIVATNATAITSIQLRNRGAVGSGDVNFDTSGVWWEEIGRATNTVASTANLVVNIPPEKRRKYYKVIVAFERATAGSVTYPMVQINNDAGANYQTRAIINSIGSGTGLINQNSAITNVGEVELAAAQGAGGRIEVDISRGQPNGWYPFFCHCASDTYVKIGGGRWQNPSVITSIRFATNGVNFTDGTEIVVLGHD